MEYLAFLFLGLGALLVLAGVLLHANDKPAGRASPLAEYAAHSSRAETRVSAFPTLRTDAGQGIAATDQVTTPASQASVPGPFQFVQGQGAAPSPVPVAVSVGKANPRLFEKFAYLYLDSSTRNVYDGAGSVTVFDLSEVHGIRRFGRGMFSYDGFGFFFDHGSGQERFPLANLKTIGFYPNCVALTFRHAQPVALLFMEETESIRKVLETFRAEHATQGAG